MGCGGWGGDRRITLLLQLEDGFQPEPQELFHTLGSMMTFEQAWTNSSGLDYYSVFELFKKMAGTPRINILNFSNLFLVCPDIQSQMIGDWGENI